MKKKALAILLCIGIISGNVPAVYADGDYYPTGTEDMVNVPEEDGQEESDPEGSYLGETYLGESDPEETDPEGFSQEEENEFDQESEELLEQFPEQQAVYTAALLYAENGSICFSEEMILPEQEIFSYEDMADLRAFEPGTEIILKVIPDEGFELQDVYVSSGTVQNLLYEVEIFGEECLFYMPEDSVAVSAVFTEIVSGFDMTDSGSEEVISNEEIIPDDLLSVTEPGVSEEEITDEESEDIEEIISEELLNNDDPESNKHDQNAGLFSDADNTDARKELHNDSESDEGVTDEIHMPAFLQSRTVSDVSVTVSADEGVFPDEAELFVRPVSSAVKKDVEEIVDEVRDEEVLVAVSYTFDIKVLDKDGNELQPADDKSVTVTFATSEVADNNLETNIYHISDEGTAEVLDVEVTNDEAAAETGGFSYYTVEFTYNKLQYVMEGDSTVRLSNILEYVGLTGEVTEVECSNTELFSASCESGEWFMTAHQAFTSEEWMRVTVNGVIYEITVTDAITLVWPVPGHTNISQPFRPANNPDHDGIDIRDSSITGVNIVAAIGGTVIAKYTCTLQHHRDMHTCAGFGTGLVIYGDDGYYYNYGHMQANSIPSGISVNSRISSGQTIGKVGTTGNSSAAHLHFGISTKWYDKSSFINPMSRSYTYSGSAPSNPVAPGKPTVSVKGTSVTVRWDRVANATGYDVYLVQSPWGWEDIKYSASGGANSVAQGFLNVRPGEYRAFIISRPNANSVQSPWVDVRVYSLKFNYNANGGSGTMASTTPALNSEYTLPANQFSRSGYRFKGWNLRRDSDSKWWVNGVGWKTAAEAEKLGKNIYADSLYFSTINSSFIQGLESTYQQSFTWFAVWEPIQQGNPVNVSAGNYIIMAKNSGGSDNTPKFLDVYWNGTSAGTNVWIYTPTGHSGSIFEIGYSDGGYWIKGKTSGKVVGTVTPNQSGSLNVQIDNDSKSKGQRWAFEDAGDGYVYIRNLHGYYLDRAGAGTDRGTNVGSYSPNKTDAQKWKLIRVSGNPKVSLSSEKYYLYCKNGGYLGLSSYSDLAKRRAFSVSQNSLFGSSQVLIRHKESGAVLMTDSNISTPGTRISFGSATDRYNGNWYLEDAGGGAFYVRNLWGYYMTGGISGGPIAASFTGSENQKWLFETSPKYMTFVTGIKLDRTTTALIKGGTATLKATIMPSAATVKDVKWSSSNPNVATVDASGKVTAKKVGNTIITVTSLDGNKKATCKVTVWFKDVPETHAYSKAVYWAVNKGITEGYSDGRFGINDTVTRGQVMTFLWRAAGKPNPRRNTQTFSDVPTSHPYYKAIQWGSEQGITTGYRNGQFGVEDYCTRGQIATFLWRYAGRPAPRRNTHTFTDVPVKHSFYKSIQWAAENGITEGYANGTFGINGSCTRGHCVTFLYRLIGR